MLGTRSKENSQRRGRLESIKEDLITQKMSTKQVAQSWSGLLHQIISRQLVKEKTGRSVYAPELSL